MSYHENFFAQKATCEEFLSLSLSYTLGFWVLGDFAHMEFSIKLTMWAKWKLLTLLSTLRPLDNSNFHSKM